MKIPALITTTIIALFFIIACEEKSATDEKAISYKHDISPILQTHCLKCHNPQGEGYKTSGLNMESYQTLMSGTKFGPIIEPGNAVGSTLVRVINAKTDPAIAMPHGGMHLLSEQERTRIANWINQGAMDN